MTKTDTPPPRSTYHSGRKPRSAGLIGLTVPTTVLSGVWLIAVLIVSQVVSFTAALVTALLGVIVVAGMTVRIRDRSALERLWAWGQWQSSRRRGQTFYRAGRFSRIPGGTPLPGVAAGTKLYEFVDVANRAFAMIHNPHTHQYTVILSAWPQGDELRDQAQVDQAVWEWSNVLTMMGETSDVDGIVPVIDTTPDTGLALLAEVEAITDPDAPRLAREVMWQAAHQATDAQVRVVPRIAITFRATTAERKRDPQEQAVELARRLPSITDAAARASVRALPMDAAEVIAFVRRSFDPAAATDVEVGMRSDDGHGLSWDDGGPVSADERRDRYYHDGAVSVTWEMHLAPRGAVTERVLARLLAPHPDLPRKRVAVVYRPHTAGDSTKIVDDDYRNAAAAQQSQRGLASVQAAMDVDLTRQARDEQAVGHGVSRFGVLITVTSPAAADIPRIDALVSDLGIQSRLKIRRCYQFQAAAFASSLGIGVLLPDHESVPRILAS
ncbi:SCO6880 family protein [Tomitella gaofuii]|uniref:SCO6880 family protein n=1 Tax=Tomitella gaofuii TaxID=2760083 RepID=UPI0015F98219|nr:SCO6880 family protein [Tomitella gaofuii]